MLGTCKILSRTLKLHYIEGIKKSLLHEVLLISLHENLAVLALLPAMFSSSQAVDVNDKSSTTRLSEIDLAA